ncbi:hypothetical protein [Streptomyces sp. NPDC060054]|uniref:hypothetical protein n=1 Tax=Streptomyces sp. NPDC060054 TaxID=3347048 RepID=UPI00093AC31B|nr:hypothetical protein A6A29_40910 [Streptomyces sp. TSRI0281]
MRLRLGEFSEPCFVGSRDAGYLLVVGVLQRSLAGHAHLQGGLELLHAFRVGHGGPLLGLEACTAPGDDRSTTSWAPS